jgi:hypothetical protein
MKTLIAFLLFFFHYSVSSQLSDGVVRKINESTLLIEGILTPKVEKQFSALLDSRIRTVIVSSEGGVTESGIGIAEEIQSRKLDIVVKDICISSCANYLFVAASKKTVGINAVVGWHGGHSFKPFRPLIDSRESLLEKEKILFREQLIYARSGVSLDLIIYSGLLTLGKSRGDKVDREYTLWAPPPEELRRLGVDNLTFEGKFFSSAFDAEKILFDMGFEGQKIFVGRSYSYLPLSANIE